MDEVDRKIVAQLQLNSRTTFEELGKLVGYTSMGAKKRARAKVILNGELVFNDCIYARAEEGNVTLKNILEETQTIENCIISQVHIGKKMLTLNRRRNDAN